MKSLIMILMIFVSSIVWAGIEDFNQLIDNNKKEQKELHQKLSKETGAPSADDIREEVNSRKELNELRRQMTPAEAEEVIVENSNLVGPTADKKSEKQLEKRNIKRLSKEFDIRD